MRLSLPSPRALTEVVSVLRLAFNRLETALRLVPASYHTFVTLPAVADTPMVVLHKLGSVPRNFAWVPESSLVVYVKPEDRALWSNTEIVLRGTVASKRVDLTIYAE